MQHIKQQHRFLPSKEFTIYGKAITKGKQLLKINQSISSLPLNLPALCNEIAQSQPEPSLLGFPAGAPDPSSTQCPWHLCVRLHLLTML